MIKRNLKVIGPMPKYYAIAEHLWGVDADIDSDGNSYNSESSDWTELTLILRDDETQRVDIDPHEQLHNTLVLSTTNKALEVSVVAFLRKLRTIE